MTTLLQIESKLKKASIFVSEQNFLAAIQIYKQLLNVKEAERTATIKLADIYDLMGKGSSAIELFNNYLNKNKDDTEVIRLVSFYLIRKLMFKEALVFVGKFDHVIDENMDYIRGILYFHTKQHEIAHLHFKNYIERYNESEFIPSIYLYLAKTHLIYSEYDEALLMAKHCIELQENFAEGYKIESEIYYKKEMFYHASESIRKAIKLDPTVIEWRHFQIKILLMLGELKKAESTLKEAIDNSPSSSELLAMLGHSYLQSEKISDARTSFEESLKINPNNIKAIEGLKLC